MKHFLALACWVVLFRIALAPLVPAQEKPARASEDKATARSELNQGAAAYRNARYEEAEDHFRKAIAADPSLTNAHLYLATTYSQEYIPGSEDPDNMRIGEQAIEQYKTVLFQNPKQMDAIKALGGLYLQMKKFDDAKTYYFRVLGLDPGDSDSYYSIGVIDWTETFQPRQEERAKLKLKLEEPLQNKEVCERLRAINTTNILEGIDYLNDAIALRPDSDDAMAYLNLMYREKADLECDDPAARAADTKTADDWVDKTLAVKKARAEKEPIATPPM